MENSNPKPGRVKHVILVVTLVISIVLAIAFFFYGMVRQMEAERLWQEVVEARAAANKFKAELDSCNMQAAIAQAQAQAAMAEANRQAQLWMQSK